MEFTDDELKIIAGVFEFVTEVSDLKDEEYAILEQIEEHLLEKRLP